MELRQMRYFLAVADEGHFGRAARQLHIVQPALSMQIRALEKEVGTQLFERTSRKVRLTNAGTLFRAEAERAVRQVDHAKEVAQRAGRGELGTVRVGFVGNAALAGNLSATLHAFQQAHPDVELRLFEMPPTQQRAAIITGELDIAYIPDFADVPDVAIRVDRIETCEWLVAMRSDHALSKVKLLAPRALRDQPFVLYSHAGDDSQLPVLRELAGQDAHVKYRVSNTLAVLTIAAAGLALALVPAPMKAISIPNLMYRPLVNTTVHVDFMLLSRHGEQQVAVKQFIAAALD